MTLRMKLTAITLDCADPEAAGSAKVHLSA